MNNANQFRFFMCLNGIMRQNIIVLLDFSFEKCSQHIIRHSHSGLTCKWGESGILCPRTFNMGAVLSIFEECWGYEKEKATALYEVCLNIELVLFLLCIYIFRQNHLWNGFFFFPFGDGKNRDIRPSLLVDLSLHAWLIMHH